MTTDFNADVDDAIAAVIEYEEETGVALSEILRTYTGLSPEDRETVREWVGSQHSEEERIAVSRERQLIRLFAAEEAWTSAKLASVGFSSR
ncbi:hypothetical protein LCGC14_0810420 [marine sediment metagenome]|uniref:Uncharacterized protein n=1 Tax=marine sediment metagenome TaxID=412755 RepID=A0A0F9SUE6_9ZZZZ